MPSRCKNNCQRAQPGPGAARGHAWLCWFWALLVSLAGSLNGPLHAQEIPVPEYQVKAVWLLNFARFVEWPATAFTRAHGPLVVGVLGKDPFGKDLEKALESK